MSQSHSSADRLVRKLQDALGPIIRNALDEPGVVEIMLNPDGKLFIERIGQGITLAGDPDAQSAETIIGIVAHALQTEADQDRPIISGELPIGGHRYEGLLPPIVAEPSFSIRKRASMLIPLAAYVREAIMSAEQAEIVCNAVEARMNRHRRWYGQREDDTRQRDHHKNAVLLHTSDVADMARLLKSTMRLRPDRIIVGEVRDGAALTLLKAWNTGHPGGVATIHANSARSALALLEQLVAEVSQMPMREVMGEAVDLIVAIERTPNGRRVSDILHIEGFRDGAYRIESHSSNKERLNVA